MMKPVENAPAFMLSLSPSWYFTGYLVLVHTALLLSLLYWPLPASAKWVVALAVLVCGGFGHWRWNDRRHREWIDRVGNSDSGLWIEGRPGRRLVRVADATVWSWLVVVNLADIDGRRLSRLCVFPDSCAGEQRRQLRVFLRHCLER